jgi:hypothetical protein
MELAIAVHDGRLSANGQFKQVRILSCSDTTVEGLHFCVQNQHVEFGRHFFVELTPDDQFCRVIPLADAKELMAVA